MTRKLAALMAVPALALAVAVPTVAGSADGSDKDVLAFDAMTGVTAPFTGPDHAIRGIAGGGAPWQAGDVRGALRADGLLKINVRGLVLQASGVNPLGSFRGAVNCLTPDEPDTGETILTDAAPASPAGNALIKQKLALSEDCVAPIAMVTSNGGAWLASTGR
jgi:hypothetical protein